MEPNVHRATLERLPMTMGYFRLILRTFGDTPQRRAAILAGTGIGEEALDDPAAEISLSQQLRQVENLDALFGQEWAFDAPELWNPASHGALGVAALTSPDLGAALAMIARYGGIRGPYSRAIRRIAGGWLTIEYRLTVPLAVSQWRSLREIAFMGLRSIISAILGRAPEEARFLFACPEPAYAGRVREALGNVLYDCPITAVEMPTAALAETSPFADAALHARAIEELDRTRESLAKPHDVRGRVERLLSTAASARLDAASAARTLGMSRRTLVRRLAASGTGYRELLDAELRRRAARLSEAGDLTQAEIAERLGYADATGLSRSRRRWLQPSADAP
ncbi:MAG TPA: AraC family transcriptional regulator ligand-binding domain-containing protein [Caulobacteraceae bacterium]|jgi:AraC-like DNA-binding protein|nr:AraC family transcriptional regulator ligand-binding domain-containing protein [Caulobacteraceae bacterium]